MRSLIASESHVPVLVLLSQLKRVESVLELGSGRFTTPLFKSRSIFPDLGRLDVLENGDETYYCAMRDEFFSEDVPGHVLHRNTAPIAVQAASIDLEAYDLILVDDSMTVPDRVETIRYITAAAVTPTLVIHDFEVEPYRKAVLGDWHAHVFTHAIPYTAVLSRRLLNIPAVYGDAIAQHFAEFRYDGLAWRSLFESLKEPQ